MSPNTCPFCEQVNPPHAKFCNACGGALHLVPCPRCGAVSDVTATVCYQCNGPLGGIKADAAAAPPTDQASKPRKFQGSKLFAGLAVLAAITALGYYGLVQRDLDGAPPAPGASNPSRAPSVDGKTVVGDATAARPADGPRSASSEASPAGASLGDQEPRADSDRHADQQPEASRRPSAAAGLIARPLSAAAKAGGQASPRKEVCTEAVAALGLCTMTPEERKLTKAVAGLKAAAASPGEGDAGKAGAQGAVRPEACTEAVAALGLCTPAVKGKGE